MVVMLSVVWISLSPLAQGEQPGPLRIILSVVLLFGIATLGASVALVVHHSETHDK